MDTITNKEVYDHLKAHEYLEYGSVIPIQLFRDICGIDTITTGTKKEFDDISLQELGYAGYLRNILLNQGKYLKGERDSYRVLLPSENQGQIISIMNSASSKLKRAIKLDNNTPAEYKCSNQDMVRMHMKQERINEKMKK